MCTNSELCVGMCQSFLCSRLPSLSSLFSSIVTDKDGKVEKALSFTLKGVVHFVGDSPECICTLCPEVSNSKKDLNRDTNGDATQVSDDTQS